MALTANPQSALRTGRTDVLWDEAIVPSLRKRLENESRVLAQRMSLTSVSDEDGLSPRDALAPLPSDPATPNGRSPGSSYSTPRQQPNRTIPSATSPAQYQPASASASGARPRTFSQPVPPDPSLTGTPRPSDVKPSRIPVVARGRTPSISSHDHGTPSTTYTRQDSVRGGSTLANNSRIYSPESGFYDEAVQDSPPASPPTFTVPLRHQNSVLVNEPAPFTPIGTVDSNYRTRMASLYADEPEPDPDYAGRMSTESDERPFEHWYRGDTSRNGGVGELRVGRRMEMLEIANHGHSLRSKHFGQPGRADEDARERETESRASGHLGVRRRADSLGARESFYLEESLDLDEARVIDEAPLTDAEVDVDSEVGHVGVHTNHQRNGAPAVNGVSKAKPATSATSTPTKRNGATPKNHRPGPPRSTTSPAASPALSKRGASEPPFTPPNRSAKASPARSPQPSQPRARSQPRLNTIATPGSGSASSPASARSRTKSAATSSPSSAAAKKARAGVSAATQKRLAREDDNRRSVGKYPGLPVDEADDGDVSLADLIPPVAKPKLAGDWDQMLMSRKGLEGEYGPEYVNQNDRRQQSVVYEPAPGTFGFDYSKYKAPRPDDGPETIPMDEFGQRRPQQPPVMEAPDEDLLPTPSPARSPRISRQPSEVHGPEVVAAPPVEARSQLQQQQAHSAPPSWSHDGHGQGQRVGLPPSRPQHADLANMPHTGFGTAHDVGAYPVPPKPVQRQQEEEDEAGGGCCKCVIM